MSHEDFVSFEQAVKLKELGFDWKCETFWEDEGSPKQHDWVIKHFHNHPLAGNDEDCTIFRPSLAQAAKWLREKDINIQVYCFKLALPIPPKLGWGFCIVNHEDKEIVKNDCTINYDSYEQALSAGIDRALELLKQQNK